jgi:hypothetical protein
MLQRGEDLFVRLRYRVPRRCSRYHDVDTQPSSLATAALFLLLLHTPTSSHLYLLPLLVIDNILLFIPSLLMKSLTLQERKWDVWKVVTSGFLNQKTNYTDVWVDRNIDCRKVLSYNFPPNSAHLALAQHATPSQQRGHEAYVKE